MRRTVTDYLSEIPTDPDTTLPVESILIEPGQPRRYFDQAKLQQLADSIKQHGIIEPLLVRRKGSAYHLVAGERRYRAAQLLNLATVPVVIKELSDEEALALSLVENLVREDLNPVEETEGILALLGLELQLETEQIKSLLYRWDNEQKGKATNNVIGSEQAQQIQEIFEGLGQNWQSFVNNRLPLLKLPSHLLEEIRKGTIAYTKAKLISTLKDEAAQQQLLSQAIAQELSLSEIKKRLQALKQKDSEKEAENTLIFQEKVTKTYKLLKRVKLEPNSQQQQRLLKLLSDIEALLNQASK